MQSVLREIVLAGLALMVATPLFAQSTIRVPEGGSDLVYLAVAGMSFAGTIWYRFRGK